MKFFNYEIENLRNIFAENEEKYPKVEIDYESIQPNDYYPKDNAHYLR